MYRYLIHLLKNELIVFEFFFQLKKKIVPIQILFEIYAAAKYSHFIYVLQFLCFFFFILFISRV